MHVLETHIAANVNVSLKRQNKLLHGVQIAESIQKLAYDSPNKKNTPHFHFDMENFTLAHKTLVYVSFDPYYYYYKNLYFNSKFHLFYVLDPKMLRNERKSHKKTLSRK
jgi:1,4-dihydroxy-2-naphthoate octaprenyltransferase